MKELSPEVLTLMAVMAGLYIYLCWRETTGSIWILLCLLILMPIKLIFPAYFVEATIVTAAAAAIVFEYLHHGGKDPFSEARFDKFTGKLLERFVSSLGVIGIKPKSTILDYQDSEETRKANDYLHKQQWDELDSYLLQMETNDRTRLISSIVNVDGRSKAFDEWIEARPHSVMARIVSGKQCIKWAWQARGGGVSSTVSSADYELFFDRLSRAKAELKYAIELGDQFSEPYVGLITVAMGTGFERGELWRYYGKAIEHCEENYEAHRAMIHALTEKWGGDEGEMHVVATKVASLAKKGSALTGILADAHLEQWLYLQMCDEHAEAESYFKQESVCDELRFGYAKLANTGPVTSAHVQALNNYAVCFYFAELYSEARDAIDQLDGKFLEYPWYYLDEPFLANFDLAFAIDHVIKRLSKFPTDLPVTS